MTAAAEPLSTPSGPSLLRRMRRLAARATGPARPQGAVPAPVLDAGLLAGVGQPVIVASHRRSGTHLTLDLLRRQFAACDAWKWPGEGIDAVYTNLDRLGRHRQPLDRERLLDLLHRAERPLLKTHETADFAKLRAVQGGWVDRLLERSKIVYVVRDGRAVMVSAERHEGRLGIDTGRDILDYMRLEEGGRSRARAWADHVEDWMAREGVLVVRYEDVIGRSAETLERIARFLDLEPRRLDPVTPPLVRGVWRKRAMRLTYLHPPTTALTPPTPPRPWRELFGPEELAYFDEQAGPVMRKLGYTSDEDRLAYAAA